MPATEQEALVYTPGNGLSVTRRQNGQGLTLVVALQTDADCILHWGLSRRGGPWQRPPAGCWPEGTTVFDAHAVRTPLSVNGNGKREVAIHLDPSCSGSNLAFVLLFPRENRWLRNGGKDFSVPLPHGSGGPLSPEAALAAWAPAAGTSRTVFPLDGGERLAAAVWVAPEVVHIRMVCDAEPPLVLHWGVAWRFAHEWQLPPESFRPAGTSLFDQLAVRTPWAERDGLLYRELDLPALAGRPVPRGLRFVLFRPEGTWLKKDGKDMYLPLTENVRDPRVASPKLWDLAGQIIAAEQGASSWTLMHRFQLCYDLVDKVQDDAEGLALLFAWLRYSAIRQLDWQRHYNTKPRDLSHAQDRLTTRLAGLWRRLPDDSGGTGVGCRLWLRLLLTTLGRGSEGQRVRDEILHIMHRNHLKEASGNFVEEWHQKLHNNTTPDDIVICEAYLAFLRSDGDLERFYETLTQGGVPRERLRSFDRPIRTDPVFYADRQSALLQDFEVFLGVLKAVHSGTDLDSAVKAAGGRLGEALHGQLKALLSLRQNQPAGAELAAATGSARAALGKALAAAREDTVVRDLLFLDLALEELQRGAIEQQNLAELDRDTLVDLVNVVLRGLTMSIGAKELAVCAGHWAALADLPREGRDWALHARSVADRAIRWVQAFSSDLYQCLQPRAEFLGEAFEVEAWTIPLFSEEVIRGGPVFALSLLLRHLEPILRQAAGLGGWQVISPARAFGRVRVAARLIDVQGERFPEATVLVADAVAGQEEIPEGVTAVLTSATPDLVAHVAVRARNAHILFATCFEPDVYQALKDRAGQTVALHTTPSGDVVIDDAKVTEATAGTSKSDMSPTRERGGDRPPSLAPRANVAVHHPVTSSTSPWVITQDQFTPEIVGGKANNLNGLRGRLPDWIQLPASVALPFGAFETALADSGNRELRSRYEALIAAAEQNPAEVLSRVRALLLDMIPPAALQESLLAAWQRAGLLATPWERVWRGIQRVWASKWTERAYLSRRARGIPHDSLHMAVLIQQVVEADYAYVIHTVNPLTGKRGEIYAEVVLGLGETLVGNYPGRALGFVCRKADLHLELVSYPGKSLGLYGKGVIFRSDSNGEDLEDFAGAGLYDSVLAEEPVHRLLDYRGEKLVWDQNFRDDLLRSIARVGLEVEKVLGTAQDIEGAVAGGKFHVVQTRPQVGLESRDASA